VAEKREVRMPEDWNDHPGWDTYYESRLARPKRDRWNYDTGSFGVDRLPGLADELKSRGWCSVWIPGCGLSPLARLLAHLGLQTAATDASPVAVAFQRERSGEFDHLTARLGPANDAGSFVAEVHDFRTEFRWEAFDLIVNTKAFQSFAAPDMVRIARVHGTALRKGRYAYFDTMNVQGEDRNQLEQALVDGGFVVPLFSLNRWFRQAMHATGIPHGMFLGQPMIPREGVYADGGPTWQQDMDRLWEITKEYRSRVPSELQDEESRLGPDAKVAHVIYSTG
jgi:SAM-dependent methyltransferase